MIYHSRTLKGCISLRYAPKHFSVTLWTGKATAVRTVPGTAALKINNHMVKVPGGEPVWSVGTELGSHPRKQHTQLFQVKLLLKHTLIRQPPPKTSHIKKYPEIWGQDSKPHSLCLAWCLKVDYHWDAKLQGHVLSMHQFLEIWHSLDLGWQITTGRFTSDDASMDSSPKQASACMSMCTVYCVILKIIQFLNLAPLQHQAIPLACCTQTGPKTHSRNKPPRRALFKACLIHALECVRNVAFDAHPILTQKYLRWRQHFSACSSWWNGRNHVLSQHITT